MTRQTGRGWMPDVDQALSPNKKTGRDGHAIEGAVMHIMDGSYQGSINWLINPVSGVSSHFAVALDGRITQLVNIFDTAYTNGLSWSTKNNCWIDPENNAVKPSWKRLRPPINPNYQTVTIEHEGRKNQVWTDAMYAADRRILLYVASQVPGLAFVAHDTLIGHNEISPVARPYCPGPGVDFNRIVASLAAEPDWSKRWGTAWPYFASSGIALAWRDAWRAGTILGAATSDELPIRGGLVRCFEAGYVAYFGGRTKVGIW